MSLINVFKECSGPKLFLSILFFLALSYVTTTLIDRIIWPNSYDIHTSSGSVHTFRISSANYGFEHGEYKLLLDQDMFAADLYDPGFFEKPSFLADVFQLKSLSQEDGVVSEVWEATKPVASVPENVHEIVFSVPRSEFIHNISENSSLLKVHVWINGQKLPSRDEQGGRQILSLPRGLTDINSIKVKITSRVHKPHLAQELVAGRSFHLKDLTTEYGRVRQVWTTSFLPWKVTIDQLDLMLNYVPPDAQNLIRQAYHLEADPDYFDPESWQMKYTLRQDLTHEQLAEIFYAAEDIKTWFSPDLTEPGYLVLKHTPESAREPRVRYFPEPERISVPDIHFELRVNGHVLPLIRREAKQDHELIYFLLPDLIFRDLSSVYSLEITKDTQQGPPQKTMLADVDTLFVQQTHLGNGRFTLTWAERPGKREISHEASPIYYVVDTSFEARGGAFMFGQGPALFEGLQDEISVSLIINGRELEFSHQENRKFFFKPDIHPAEINDLRVTLHGPIPENHDENILQKTSRLVQGVSFIDEKIHHRDLALNIDHVDYMSNNPDFDLAEYSVPFFLGTPFDDTAIDAVRFYVFSNKLPFDINLKTMNPAEITRVFEGSHNLDYKLRNQSLKIDFQGPDPYLYTTDFPLLKSTLQKPLKNIFLLINAGFSLVFFLLLAVFNRPLDRFSRHYARSKPEDNKPVRFLALAFFILNFILALLFGQITLGMIGLFAALSALLYLGYPLINAWFAHHDGRPLAGLSFIPKRIAANVFLYLLFIVVLKSAGYTPGWYVITVAITWSALALIWLEIRHWSPGSDISHVRKAIAGFADRSWTPGPRAVLNIVAAILALVLVYAFQSHWTAVLLVILLFISVMLVMNLNRLACISNIVESGFPWTNRVMNVLLKLSLCAFTLLTINPLLILAGEHGLVFTIIAAIAGFWAFYLNQTGKIEENELHHNG